MDSKTNRPKLNEEQQAAAFCAENAVVAAGAGSGKTMVLANRFAWLLTEKDFKVNEILTLTFTTKAAAQMYRRIHTLLSEIAGEEAGIRSQRARQALDDFIHARIQTLDSYSAALVRQCVSRYGISPNFSIDQERCYNLAFEESLPFLIANRHHPAIERLYSGSRPKEIVQDIFSLVLFNYSQIDKERDIIRDVKTQFDTVCAEWKNQCAKIIKIL
jgi:ATP-dependent helicase/nuclease subunit A